MNRSDNLQEWQRRVALDFAQACPSELTEADWDAADRAEDQGKGARRNALRDRIALEDQVQHLRLIGGL